MDAEDKVVEALSDLVLKTHKNKETYDSWGENNYQYLAIDYDGPYVDEETGKKDKNYVMYVVSVDAHLSLRIDADDKEQYEYEYNNFYAWVNHKEKFVDLVGMENFYDDDRVRVVNNLTAFFEFLEKKSS